MGLSMVFFYVAVYGSSGGSISWVLGWLFLVRVGVRYRLLWFWVLGGLGGVGMVRKWKWYLLAKSGGSVLMGFAKACASN